MKSQLRREQSSRSRVVGRNEDCVDVLTTPRLELDRHAETRREPKLALVAARDVQEAQDRARKFWRAGSVPGVVGRPPAASLYLGTERRERAPAAVAVRYERDRGL